jgi:hypothetical protein
MKSSASLIHVEGAKDGASKVMPNAVPNLVIPSGLPPYPGHGPKWPWHPDSPRAPDGYRECYMNHMGEAYHRYMEHLQTCFLNKNADETTDEILRSSLSSLAAFNSNKVLSKTKPPKPAILPSTFASKPCGRARKDCAVPIVLPKIEEGSNSSSGSSANARRTQSIPDANIVGTIHPKIRGKKGTIVVVTGKELDQKMKEERKLDRQMKHTGVVADTKVEPISTKAENKARQLEQPITTTEVDIINQCACTIM